MAARPDLVEAPGERVDLGVRHPFRDLHAAVLSAVEARYELDSESAALNEIRVTESDRLRLAAGFDFSVPCIAFGRVIDRRPGEVAHEVAALLDRSPSNELVMSAESDGPYLNLRVNRHRFSDAVVESTRSASLAECRHSHATRTQYCLVAADDSAPPDLLSLLNGMVSNCSGSPADPLDVAGSETQGLVAELVGRRIAERDPSGLTDAVMMGDPGDRFLLMSPGGKPTTPASLSARLVITDGRPVLLTVGAHNLDLVHRVETVARAVGFDRAEVRVIEVHKHWLRLVGELQRAVSGIDPDRISSSLESGPVRDDTFAVHRWIARLFEVNHRVLQLTEPDHGLRFAKELRNRVRAVNHADPIEGEAIRELAQLAVVHLMAGGTGGG